MGTQGREGKGPLPADHLPVPVHRDVGPGPVVIRSKVTVGGSKPLIKSVLQGVELRPVAQMPRNRNPGHFRESHMGTPQSSKQQRSVTFTEYLMRQKPPSTQSVLSPGTERPCPQEMSGPPALPQLRSQAIAEGRRLGQCQDQLVLLTSSVPWPEMGIGRTRRKHSNVPTGRQLPGCSETQVLCLESGGRLQAPASHCTCHAKLCVSGRAVTCFPVPTRPFPLGALNVGSSCRWEVLTCSPRNQVPVVREHGPTCSLEYRANRGSSPCGVSQPHPGKRMGFLGFCLQKASCSDGCLESHVSVAEGPVLLLLLGRPHPGHSGVLQWVTQIPGPCELTAPLGDSVRGHDVWQQGRLGQM